MNPFSYRHLATSAAVALAAISLSPGSAQAVLVTVGGVQYDVTTFTGSYNANTSKFALPTNGGVMPWYGSQSRALEFADAVGDTFGSPLFYAWDYKDPNPVYDRVQVALWFGSGSTGTGFDEVSSYQYAQVASTPVPAPLPVLGSAAALGFCRRLRSRSQRLRYATGSRLA